MLSVLLRFQFWFQAQGADYETQASYINQMIADPSFVPPPAASSSSNAGPSTAASLSVPASGLPPTTPAQQSTSSSTPAAPNPTRTVGFDLGTAGSSSGYSPAQLEQLRAMLEAQVGSAGESASDSGTSSLLVGLAVVMLTTAVIPCLQTPACRTS